MIAARTPRRNDAARSLARKLLLLPSRPGYNCGMPIDASVRQKWVQAGVVVAVLFVAAALAVPWIQKAREAARRLQSKNNLKQIGLALANYHDVYACLPPGGTFDADGRAYHGWFTIIWPFLEDSPIPNQIDMRQPWNSAYNSAYFRIKNAVMTNPSLDDQSDETGFGLAHYSCNSHLLAANRGVATAQIDDAANTFLAGELGGDFIPWGCPWNWRPLTSLDASPRTYGRPDKTGGQFLMVDGSVRWITPDVSADVLESLRGSDLAGSAARGIVLVRPKSFPVPPDALWIDAVRFGDHLYGDAMRNNKGQLVSLRIGPVKESESRFRNEHLLRIGDFPDLLKLSADGPFTDEGVARLATLTRLQELSLSSENISDDALAFLDGMRDLKTLHLARQSITPKFIARLRKLEHLEELYLSMDEVAEEVRELNDLPGIRKLWLRLHSDRVTDGSLEVIADVRALDDLTIESNAISDAGLQPLFRLTGLAELDLKSTRITGPGVVELQEQMPWCKVYRREP